ncbi:uncharacterized protein LOC104434124 [Eucalyptus grandis]|uniref:Uncharacterized protein n=2 Tax=Eucalyptus grandis TaxID=71139 RepID=A0ACC3LZ85_EUCGR|nr:uncharacterized protein LOC104434124 [Eucalyptus grandis]KAK3443968.1 hypothetical protein EUGRSUZ_B04008 [Eucalyptus grandis]
MGNSLRCCLACVLPCGALDLIRIVHLNGYVEEITRHITAGEVLKAHPNHVLSKPCAQGVVRRILILSPESELKRGSIYFLIPASSLPQNKKRVPSKAKAHSKKSHPQGGDVPDCDRHLAISKKKSSSRRDRRHSRTDSTWRPHLESIYEDS